MLALQVVFWEWAGEEETCGHFICLNMLWCVLIILALSQRLRVRVWVCPCGDVQYKCRGLLCLSFHLRLWQPPRPPRTCCHMLAASVRAEQKAKLCRDSPLCVFLLLYLLLCCNCAPADKPAPCLQLRTVRSFTGIAIFTWMVKCLNMILHYTNLIFTPNIFIMNWSCFT